MSPRTRKITLSVGALITALIAVGGWAVNASPSVVKAIDGRYVHATRYSVDSVEHRAEVRRIDTALAQLIRACQHRKECP